MSPNLKHLNFEKRLVEQDLTQTRIDITECFTQIRILKEKEIKLEMTLNEISEEITGMLAMGYSND